MVQNFRSCMNMVVEGLEAKVKLDLINWAETNFSPTQCLTNYIAQPGSFVTHLINPYEMHNI